MPSPRWPRWWDWELELTPHLEKLMEDRGFTELDLRAMIERADGFRPDVFGDRFIIVTRHRGGFMKQRYLEVTFRRGKPLAAYLHLSVLAYVRAHGNPPECAGFVATLIALQ